MSDHDVAISVRGLSGSHTLAHSATKHAAIGGAVAGGAMPGVSKPGIARNFDAIVSFSGTEKSLDAPVREVVGPVVKTAVAAV